MSKGEHTRALASFAFGLESFQISGPARLAARHALLNWFGCAIGGSRQDAVNQLLGSLSAAGCLGTVPIVGRSEQLNPLSATLVNGTASAVLDFDSPQQRKTNIHPSGPIVPAMLAYCASGGQGSISGEDFLVAYIAGVDVACRIANTVFGEHNAGWHVTGVAGGPGAAVAVAKLMKLPEPKIVTAIGIAATQGGGLREMYGTMCKALTPGRSGENGLLAALLASNDFTSASAPLEGGKGLAAVFSGLEDISDISEGLGRGFEIEAIAHKPYPCAVVTHAVIDACIAMSEHIESNEITSIHLTVSPIAVALAGKSKPQNELEAKFSLAQTAAIALVHRAVRLEHFQDMALRDVHTAHLSEMVSLDMRSEFSKYEAVVQVGLRNGEKHEMHVPHATGSRENPMSESQLLTKFHNLTDEILNRRKADQLSAAVLGIENMEDVTHLFDFSCP